MPIVQTIDSQYDREATTAINTSLELPGTSLAEVHTHPSLVSEDKAIIPSVISEDEDGEYGGDLNSFLRPRRVRQERITRGASPLYAERELKAIFQSFPHLDIIHGLFIKESEYLAALPEAEYTKMLLDNDSKIRGAGSTTQVCEALRSLGYKTSFVEVPRVARYAMFDESQVTQLTTDLGD